MTVESRIRSIAEELMIDAVGFAPLSEVPEEEMRRYSVWLQEGKNGSMDYLENYREVRRDPRLLLPDARSVIVIAVSYFPEIPQPSDAPQVAKYALGRDYHKVMKRLLMQLGERISDICPHSYRPLVDTAPLLERYWARRSGIGFIGRNSNLIIPGMGSFVFLGELLTTLPLSTDRECHSGCGACRRCVEACPTSALHGSGIDARRCINYLTIEHRGDIEATLARRLGNRLYGCDTCQDVCPYNRSPKTSRHFTASPRLLRLTDQSLVGFNSDTYAKLFYGSAATRAKEEGMTRNVNIYITNKKATQQ
ncbi:MAG: tRNA epoxyqueuosine(34) reductase QueG [Porphyromonas sp.]|nr:tRNA epoxyqueuosine(34) reductase QueG [Porphyromonas sp.]